MKYRIVDLDNCIADDGWRIPLIKVDAQGDERFQLYHHAGLEDKVGNADLFENCHQKLVVFTSRPAYYRARTNWWLQRKSIHAVALFMRESQDHRASDVIKDEMLDRFLRMGISLDSIEDAYDDRQSVVDMFLRAGIKAERRWIHEVPYPKFVI